MVPNKCYRCTQFQKGYCPSTVDLRCSMEAKYPEADSNQGIQCNFQFSSDLSDTCSTDTYPFSVTPLPQSNKVDNGYPYPTTILSSSVYSQRQNVHCFPVQQPQHFEPPISDSIDDTELRLSPLLSNSTSYRTGPGTNNIRVRTNDKYRMVYSTHQKLELEKQFLLCQFINSERKAQLSSSLRLTERQIKIWFQNRRAKERREQKKQQLKSFHRTIV